MTNKDSVITLTVCTIVKNDKFFLSMMLESALQFADEIILVDDFSTDGTGEMVKKINDKRIKYFKLEFGADFGKGRQFANDHATSDWIFFLDADEVIHENQTPHIKNLIDKSDKDGLETLHVEYLHFIYNFKWIDNSEPLHVGLYRVYKNIKGITYRYKNHSYAFHKWKKIGMTSDIVIWHLGYLRGMEKILERFDRNYHFSEMHTPPQQVRWRDWHYFGEYPTKKINPKAIPKIIKDKFSMELGGGEICG